MIKSCNSWHKKARHFSRSFPLLYNPANVTSEAQSLKLFTKSNQRKLIFKYEQKEMKFIQMREIKMKRLWATEEAKTSVLFVFCFDWSLTHTSLLRLS